jgi:hypothetical protein
MKGGYSTMIEGTIFTQFEAMLFILGLLLGAFITMIASYISLRKIRRQLYKLRGQLYYWFRQRPVPAKRGRPSKRKSVK